VTRTAPADRTVLLLCNGEPPPRAIARRLSRHAQLIVAADGGANAARAIGLKPDVIIGDLDSVKISTLRAFKRAHVIRVRRQDNTDMEKALDFIKREGFRHVILLGATGRRIDMTLGNLAGLWRYVPRIDILIAGNGWYAVPVCGTRELRAPLGTTVSIIPHGACSGVTLRGLKYGLANATLGSNAVAVSNVVRRVKFSVSIKRGKALVVVLHDISVEASS
jgi:thiamine pyrophosphokinase